MDKQSIKEVAILSLGLVVSSIIFSLAFCYTRSVGVQRISVKGLSEREVDANVGIWTIDFEAVDNDLNQVNAQIKQQTAVLVDFLKQQGFADKEIIYGSPVLNDRGKYRDNAASLRYSLEMKVIVHSPNVFLLYETVQKSQELMKIGVCLTHSRWDGPVKFIFTNLNAIKPSMIQEATINAKKAANQFAHDANIRLGGVLKAAQGTFSIEDTHIPTKKRVRIVTYMDYAIQ